MKFAGAKIFGEQDFPLLPILCVLPGRKPVIFFQENGGVRQPEAVDALFDITHGKDILAIPGHCLEDGVLYFVGVLVLIY